MPWNKEIRGPPATPRTLGPQQPDYPRRGGPSRGPPADLYLDRSFIITSI